MQQLWKKEIMTTQEKAYFWAIYDAIMNEANKQGDFICCGFKVDDEVHALVDAILDCEMHGSTLRRDTE